jgi:hypothetical protein
LAGLGFGHVFLAFQSRVPGLYRLCPDRLNYTPTSAALASGNLRKCNAPDFRFRGSPTTLAINMGSCGPVDHRWRAHLIPTVTDTKCPKPNISGKTVKRRNNILGPDPILGPVHP